MNRNLSYFLVDFDNGDSQAVSMAAGITLDQARAHYIGTEFTEEDPESGAESVRTGVAVNYLSMV